MLRLERQRERVRKQMVNIHKRESSVKLNILTVHIICWLCILSKQLSAFQCMVLLWHVVLYAFKVINYFINMHNYFGNIITQFFGRIDVAPLKSGQYIKCVTIRLIYLIDSTSNYEKKKL